MKNDISELKHTPKSSLLDLKLYLANIYSGYRETCLLKAAIDDGVFDLLKEPHTVEEISKVTGKNELIVSTLCRALEKRGLLDIQDGKYIDSLKSTEFLTSSSEFSLLPRVRFNLAMLEDWADLPERLNKGPIVDSEKNIYGINWMSAIESDRRAEGIPKMIDVIADNVDIASLRKVLELGPGHGLHLIGLCGINSNIQPYILDRPGMIDFTKANMQSYGITPVAMAGDYRTDDFGGGYDLVMTMFNSAGSDPEMCGKIAKSIVVGGHLFVRRAVSTSTPGFLSDVDEALRHPEGSELHYYPTDDEMRSRGRTYDDRMSDYGFRVKDRRRMDTISEVIMYERIQ